jgi:DNA-binding protein H-NS
LGFWKKKNEEETAVAVETPATAPSTTSQREGWGMEEFDLFRYSVKDLRDLRSRIEKAIEHRRTEAKQRLRSEILELAESEGLSLDEVFEVLRGSPRRAGKPKYRNPDNPSESWSGAGDKPAWVEEGIATGVLNSAE